jgi:hypothetical protein
MVVKDPETGDIFSADPELDPARLARKLKGAVKKAQAITDAIAACSKPYCTFPSRSHR